jgi:hypothetical protein
LVSHESLDAYISDFEHQNFPSTINTCDRQYWKV